MKKKGCQESISPNNMQTSTTDNQNNPSIYQLKITLDWTRLPNLQNRAT